MSINDSWEKIEQWLVRYAPEDELPAPATSDGITRLHSLNIQVPQDIEQSLLRHDGSGYVAVIPPRFSLYSIDKIVEAYTEGPFYKEGESVYFPIGGIGGLEMVVDIRTGRIGSHDPVQGFFWDEDPLWMSFSQVLAFVADVLHSPPPWIAMLPGDEEWEATHEHADFPGTLVWTEDPVD